MADTSPPAVLLDRAGRVFALATQLGGAFHDEIDWMNSGVQAVDPMAWTRHELAFNEFCAAVLELRDDMPNPPDGYAPVADVLNQAALLAQLILDEMRTSDGQTYQLFREHWSDLHGIGASGEVAIRVAEIRLRSNKPSASQDRPAAPAPAEAVIDTTPTVPEPPASLIEEAARAIPAIMANVRPQSDGTTELVAARLVGNLRDANHTLAATHWAVHRTVQAGRLRTGPVAVELPGADPAGSSWVGSPDLSHLTGRGMNVIPTGQSTPFDRFKVVATASLWEWWRSLDSGADRRTPPRDHQNAEPTATSIMAVVQLYVDGAASNDRMQAVAAIVNNPDLTVNEKLTNIDQQLPIPASATAEKLGVVLKVSKQAVMKSEWWKVNRSGKRQDEESLRFARHERRKKEFETPGRDDDR